jgi:hypothetical protein
MTPHLKSILLIALCATSSWAADWYVGTASDLTNAVANAVSNDTVWLSNGTYVVNLAVGAGVTVRSISGSPANVVLDGNVADRVVTNTASSWLIGCTVRNGMTGADEGGGVYGGIVSNCIISGNSAYTAGGGAAFCTLFNSSLISNSADQVGGAVGCTLFNSSIISNLGPLLIGGAENCTLYNCVVAGNSGDFVGGFVSCYAYNCTLTGNSSSSGAGGAYASTLFNCVSWGNSSADSDNTEAYSCGEGYTGTGSTTNDPLFVSASDFRLQAGSPCINTGTNGAWVIGKRDLDGNPRIWPLDGTVDMGAYEYGSHATWPVTLFISGSSLTSIEAASINSVKGREQE